MLSSLKVYRRSKVKDENRNVSSKSVLSWGKQDFVHVNTSIHMHTSLYACFASCFLNFTVHVSGLALFFEEEYFIAWRYPSLFHRPPVGEHWKGFHLFSTITYNIVTRIPEHLPVRTGVSLAVGQCPRSGVYESISSGYYAVTDSPRERGRFCHRVTLDKPPGSFAFLEEFKGL